MVPKIIHYCWFGGNPLPELAVKCIESWKKYCPDYEIIEWNERNYSIETACQFVKDAYENQKWAFVSDYVRLDVVYQHGGIYLDTDVELLKSPSEVLKNSRGFFGREQGNSIATGLGFACEKGEPILKEMMEKYHSLQFAKDRLVDLACPIINTQVLKKHGIHDHDITQIIDGICIFSTEFLCPESIYTGKSNYTHNTISVHHYSGSWMPEKDKRKMWAIIGIKKMLPKSIVELMRNILRKKN